MIHRVLCLVCALLLAIGAAALAAACSSDAPPPQWVRLTGGTFTGDKTQVLDLGTYYVGGDLRLAWDLAAASGAKAEFTLEAARAEGTGMSTTASSVRSWKNFDLVSDAALTLDVASPGETRVTLTQRLPKGSQAGFTGSFTLYGEKAD